MERKQRHLPQEVMDSTSILLADPKDYNRVAKRAAYRKIHLDCSGRK